MDRREAKQLQAAGAESLGGVGLARNPGVTLIWITQSYQIYKPAGGGRLIEVGVRCVEVTLTGWDTHANNHAQVRDNLKTLDPAFAALLRDLRERKLLDRTVVWFKRNGELSPSELGATLCRVFLEGAQQRPAHIRSENEDRAQACGL